MKNHPNQRYRDALETVRRAQLRCRHCGGAFRAAARRNGKTISTRFLCVECGRREVGG